MIQIILYQGKVHNVQHFLMVIMDKMIYLMKLLKNLEKKQKNVMVYKQYN